MLGEVLDGIRTFLREAPEGRSRIFAYFVVPGLIVIFLATFLSPIRPIQSPEDAISAATIRMSQDTGGVSREENQLLLIMEPRDVSFKIPWKNGTARRVFLSLDERLVRLNHDRIRFGSDNLAVTLPLYGISEPIALIADARPDSDIAFLQRRLPLGYFRLQSRQSSAYALWGIIWSTFVVGLFMSAEPAQARKGKKASRKERAAKNK
ncbi:MAG TPA: hypothetical protein VOA80_15145 [Thermoanaerobaculia bacterium]|nr:hypothetical protein [Thermoanaerobaculia bacterium]